MRTLQTIFAGLVAIALIVGGLAVAAMVAMAAFVVVAVNRLLGRKSGVRVRFDTPSRRPRRDAGRAEAIDIEAAEVSTPPRHIAHESR